MNIVEMEVRGRSVIDDVDRICFLPSAVLRSHSVSLWDGLKDLDSIILIGKRVLEDAVMGSKELPLGAGSRLYGSAFRECKLWS